MLAALLPSACAACAAPGPSPCPACAARLRPAPALPTPAGLAACAALVAHEGAGRRLVAGIKFRGRRAGLVPVAAALAALVDPAGLDVATWAPTSPARRRARGFDQAEALARAVAARAGLPVRPLLRRVPGAALTGRSRAQRWGAVRFEARGPSPPRVLVVDDVVTTGATLAAAAAALARAGAASVVGLALAATPLKAGPAAADNQGEGPVQRRPP